MSNAFFQVPYPQNEPILQYAPGSPERASLKAKLDEMSGTQIEIPLIIGGKEYYTQNKGKCVMPHDHGHVLATFNRADASHVELAAKAARAGWEVWSEMAWEQRASVFLKAAELLAGPYRNVLNAATMLCQSKTPFQAEIDAACELIDFFRFNVHFMTEIYRDQPMHSPAPTWNRSEYRALEGFVFAITPFNFTSIAANLPTAPALMGTVSLWKPAETAIFSGYYIMKLLEAAGLPPGVINFIPGPASQIGAAALTHRDFAGVHFTGSTSTFNNIWQTIAGNLNNYRCYPRIVGETGGKDFIFAHESADLDALAACAVRGAFEYQGQKCSAASRMYVPTSVWPQLKSRMCDLIAGLKMGDPRDFSNFMGAVIDTKSFQNIAGYIDHARESSDAKIIAGGGYDSSKGYFVQPTLIETSNPGFKSICEEIFGPVLTLYPYDPKQFDETLALCDQTSPYALTGAIFSNDRAVIAKMNHALRHAAGNFYINDKPTGAVVGQQPFGGARASGTNDKAGSKINLLKWVNARSVKENFMPPTVVGYPHMLEP